MRTLPKYALILSIALAVAGCSTPTGVSLPSIGGSGAASAPSAAESTPGTATSPSAPPAANGTSPTAAAPAGTTANDATAAAIKAVIQKADQEQQDAIAKKDPTLMKDTATGGYYDEMAKTNSDLANGGVTSIKLVKIDWGSITLTDSATAKATAYESWETHYSDGSTDQSRDQNDYTLVMEQGSWKIQSDDQPNSNPKLPGSAGTTPSGPHLPGPSATPAPPPSGAPMTPTDVSGNWAGYAATSGTFTGVTGTWTVPQPEAGSSGGLSSGAAWVGIGGVQSRDLIQAGTQETTDHTGTVHYQAWIETLPAPSQQVPFSVSPGDSVTVNIDQKGSDQWSISFKNNSTGESYQTAVQYASSLSSAEWIEEAPSAGRRILPIDNFGSIQFSGGMAVEDGKPVTIAQAGAQPITLAGQGGNAIASPSALTPDGQGFTVTQTGQSTPSRAPRGFGL